MVFLLLQFSFIFSASIEVNSLSYVSGDKVHLIDIVEAKEVSEKTERQLAKIELSDQLTKNSYRVFAKGFLIDLMKSSNIDKSIKIKIPEKAYVANTKNIWTKENLSDGLQEKMQSRCADCEIEINIKQANKMKNTISWNYEIKNDYRNQTIYIPLSVQYVKEGKLMHRKTQITADVFFRKEVPVLNTNINRDTRIEEGDLVMRKILLPNHGRFFTDKKDIVGKKTRRVLQQGQLIMFDDLDKKIAIRRGQEIQALVNSNNIEISLSVVAREDGQLGDLIRVTIPETKKEAHAKIKTNSLVELR